MSDKKITYLLGAGASAQSMPVVSGMNQRMQIFRDFITSPSEKKMFQLGAQPKPTNSLVECLYWLIDEEARHYSIDTLARKLHIREETENTKALKAGLICYFLFEQMDKDNIQNDIVIKNTSKTDLNEASEEKSRLLKGVLQKVDKRYDAFFASVLERSGNEYSNYQYSLNKNVDVISWNYDVQFELSFASFRNQNLLDVLPSLTLSANTPGHGPENPGLTKLNGSILTDITLAHLSSKSEQVYNFIRTGKINRRGSDMFKTLYSDLNAVDLSSFNFAWENNANTDMRTLYAKQLLKESDVIIVIGYSFPYYNNEIDREIFSSAKPNAIVYVQDLPEKFEILKDRIQTLVRSNVKVVEVKGTDLFFLPPDFLGLIDRNRHIDSIHVL